MVIVMVIMAVAAAIAVPRFAAAQRNYRADSTARQVVAQFDLAVRRARGAGRTLTLNVDTTRHTLTWTDPDNNTVAALRLADQPFHATIVSSWHEGGGNLELDGFGKPCGDSKLVVGVGTAQRTIVFDADTAEATYQ